MDRFVKAGRPGWYAWLVVVGSSVVSSFLALMVALHLNASSTRRLEEERKATDIKWCAIVSTLDDSYRESPPTTATGKNLAVAMAELRKQLLCPPTKPPALGPA